VGVLKWVVIIAVILVALWFFAPSIYQKSIAVVKSLFVKARTSVAIACNNDSQCPNNSQCNMTRFECMGAT